MNKMSQQLTGVLSVSDIQNRGLVWENGTFRLATHLDFIHPRSPNVFSPSYLYRIAHHSFGALVGSRMTDLPGCPDCGGFTVADECTVCQKVLCRHCVFYDTRTNQRDWWDHIYCRQCDTARFALDGPEYQDAVKEMTTD